MMINMMSIYITIMILIIYQSIPSKIFVVVRLGL